MGIITVGRGNPKEVAVGSVIAQQPQETPEKADEKKSTQEPHVAPQPDAAQADPKDQSAQEPEKADEKEVAVQKPKKKGKR